MSAKPYSVVLGAGLMGRLMAHQLSLAGHRVVVHEALGADAMGSAARVAAAMLAPLAESAITEPIVVRMGQYALNRWPHILSALSKPVFFQQNGTLIVWHRQDAGEAKRFEQLLINNQKQTPQLPELQKLGQKELALYEPSLSDRFMQALYLPEEGQLDNRQLLDALLKSLIEQGVEIYWNSLQNPDYFKNLKIQQPDWIIDCRGLGAKPQWSGLRGVRGEVIRLYAPDVQLQRPTRLIHPRYPIYIAPKPDHVYVVGATEIETDDVSPASVRSTLELLSAAYSVHPGFGEARIIENATQARPTLKDNLPAIQRIGQRVLQINGLYRHGFLIAPAMMDCALEIIEHGHSDKANDWGLNIQSAAT